MENNVNAFLENDQLSYLYGDLDNMTVSKCPGLELSDFALFKVTEITYEEDAPRKEAVENFLSTMRIKGFNLVFLVVGEKDKTSFYYGVARDLSFANKPSLSATSVGDKLLRASISGNFRGTKVSLTSDAEKETLIKRIESLENVCVIDGVPGINEDKEKFQGLDRFVDTMQGDEYVLIITARYVPNDKISNIEKRVNRFYKEIYPNSKISIQKGENDSSTEISSKTTGRNDSTSEAVGTNVSDSNGSSENNTIGESKTITKGSSHTDSDEDDETSDSESTSTADGKNSSKQTGTNRNHTNGSSDTKTTTKGTNESVNTGSNVTKGTSESVSKEHLNKNALEWIKYLDDVLYKRIDYGKGKGLFVTSISVCASDMLYLKKAQNTLTALFSGSSGNKVPLRNNIYITDSDIIASLKGFQVPQVTFNTALDEFETYTRSSLSQYVTQKNAFLGNWFSVKELSLITCLPQKEVIGLKLREQVEFGLNYADDIPKEDQLILGNLVQSGKEMDIPIKLNRKDLDKHVFVTGVTGSGKTTTCQNILIKSGLPFLVVEPAKTEYRALRKRSGFEDTLIFTLGNDGIAPFRMNPLEFIKGESISSHVDMLKACIESAFDMEAAIPQIIESAIYKSYEDCGWDTVNNTNKIYGDDAFAPGVNSFPTLSELIKNCSAVVEKQGFDQRLKDEYIGSINARLQGLVCGSKGQMLDCRRSIDFTKLLRNKVVLELEDIKSGSEKALIMGLILSNLQESIKHIFKENPGFKHITLIEEAHRLLSKYEPGDAPSKKHGVEIFADMLAEVRKYGEALIIADQIPSKLTQDVIKNTNTKIVHKIFAQDDKECIGNTMALSDEQKRFLSSLNAGRTVVF